MNTVQEQIDFLKISGSVLPMGAAEEIIASMEALLKENERLHNLHLERTKSTYKALTERTATIESMQARIELLESDVLHWKGMTKGRESEIDKHLARIELLEKVVEALDAFQSRLDEGYKGWPIGGPEHSGDWEEQRQLRQARAALNEQT